MVGKRHTRGFTFAASAPKSNAQTVRIPKHLGYVFPELKFPKSGITALYGHNNTTTVLRAAILKADGEGKELTKVEIALRNDTWTNHNIGLEPSDHAPPLSEIKVLNLTRMRSDLNAHVSGLWKGFIRGPCPQSEMAPKKFTERPDLVERLHDQPEFSHLDAITYTVKTEYGFVGMVTIFNVDAIEAARIVFGKVGAEVVTPKI